MLYIYQLPYSRGVCDLCVQSAVSESGIYNFQAEMYKDRYEMSMHHFSGFIDHISHVFQIAQVKLVMPLSVLVCLLPTHVGCVTGINMGSSVLSHSIFGVHYYHSAKSHFLNKTT
jgi:hypothetical protein